MMLRREARPKLILSEGQLHFLRTGEDGGDPDVFLWVGDEAEQVWIEVGEILLEEWVGTHPGRRPWGWWAWSSPEAVRKRLGGVGTISTDALAEAPWNSFGIPRMWVTAEQVEYYNRRGKDINGDLLPYDSHWEKDYFDGGFPFEALDPSDPPVFESEPTFLRRHKLFIHGEEERLTDTDFEAEVVGG